MAFPAMYIFHIPHMAFPTVSIFHITRTTFPHFSHHKQHKNSVFDTSTPLPLIHEGI